ncbi:MAG: hypothetical protein ACLQUT_06655 [Thermoleophilia bacterium]
MSKCRDQSGFVLLAVLALAVASFVAVGAAAVLTSEVAATTGADLAGAGADAAARAGMTAAAEELRWGSSLPAGPLLSFTGPCGDGAAYDVVMTADLAGAAPGSGQTFVVNVTGRCGTARRQVTARLLVQPSAIAAGCAVAGDCIVEAPTQITGSGLYVGGNVTGRQLVIFGGARAVGPALDSVHPDLWLLAAVHAGGSIFVDEIGEEHEAALPAGPDSDVHAGTRPPAAITAMPAAKALADLRAHAVDPGAALRDDELYLDELPLIPLDAAGRPARGVVIFVAPANAAGSISISGQGAPGANPVTVVVDGNARVVAGAGVGASFSGALVVTGEATIEAPLNVQGCVFAGGLHVRAPFTVTMPFAWPRAAPAGYYRCSLAALE